VTAALRGWALLRDPALGAVLAALDGDGRSTRIVGGAVRDALLGRPVADADLATVFRPAEVIARADAAGMKTAPTGIAHGTVTVISQGRPFEVTTLRRDVETDGRRAVVDFTADWAEDASRRDFTMNALYCDVGGEILDPLGGLADLRAGRVRFIGSAEDRIREDYLRILRFFRFFAWYGTGRPDPAGLKACARLKGGIATLSAERIWAELRRLLAAPDPCRSLLWMRTTEVLQKALPECWGIDAVHRLVAAEGAEGWQPDALLRLEAILPPHRARIDALAERLRLSKGEAARLLAWADAPEPDPSLSEAELAKALYRRGSSGIVDRLRHAFARERDAGHPEAAGKLQRLLAFAESWDRPSFPLTGRDLLAMGLPAGPEVGARLKALEDEWVEGGFRLSRDELLAAAAVPAPKLLHP
jgi:poly(A) polymerase/tRNA nucleotidyltransferase (CCA-adding enzyme)